jgi:hypothetical protein
LRGEGEDEGEDEGEGEGEGEGAGAGSDSALVQAVRRAVRQSAPPCPQGDALLGSLLRALARLGCPPEAVGVPALLGRLALLGQGETGADSGSGLTAAAAAAAAEAEEGGGAQGLGGGDDELAGERVQVEPVPGDGAANCALDVVGHVGSGLPGQHSPLLEDPAGERGADDHEDGVVGVAPE